MNHARATTEYLDVTQAVIKVTPADSFPACPVRCDLAIDGSGLDHLDLEPGECGRDVSANVVEDGVLLEVLRVGEWEGSPLQ